MAERKGKVTVVGAGFYGSTTAQRLKTSLLLLPCYFVSSVCFVVKTLPSSSQPRSR